MPQAFIVDPKAVYDNGDLLLGLGVTSSALAQARKAKQLRFARKGKRVLYRGQWVIDWLDSDSRPGGGKR
ncbi:MAG: hypothetical protein ACYTEQ_18465 [Planctomycetota bacterium]